MSSFFHIYKLWYILFLVLGLTNVQIMPCAMKNVGLRIFRTTIADCTWTPVERHKFLNHVHTIFSPQSGFNTHTDTPIGTGPDHCEQWHHWSFIISTESGCTLCLVYGGATPYPISFDHSPYISTLQNRQFTVPQTIGYFMRQWQHAEQ